MPFSSSSRLAISDILEKYTDRMLPAFFDSLVSLIVKTSTELPPDVRSAMKVAMAQEPAETQSGQALSIIAQNIDLAADGALDRLRHD